MLCLWVGLVGEACKLFCRCDSGKAPFPCRKTGGGNWSCAVHVTSCEATRLEATELHLDRRSCCCNRMETARSVGRSRGLQCPNAEKARQAVPAKVAQPVPKPVSGRRARLAQVSPIMSEPLGGAAAHVPLPHEPS